MFFSLSTVRMGSKSSTLTLSVLKRAKVKLELRGRFNTNLKYILLEEGITMHTSRLILAVVFTALSYIQLYIQCHSDAS